MNDQQLAAVKQALEAQQYAIACLTNQLSTKDKHAYAVEKLDASIAAIKQALAAPVQPVDFETWFSSEERFNDAPKDDYPITYLGMEKLAKDSMRYAWNAAHAAPPAAQPAPVQEPSPGGVLFAVEQAIESGDCPMGIEIAFEAYEKIRMEKNNG